MKVTARSPFNFGGPIKKGQSFECTERQGQSLIAHGLAAASEAAPAAAAPTPEPPAEDKPPTRKKKADAE